MCLILFASGVHADYRLVLAANRDEFVGRPTDVLHAWPGERIIAGRDRRGGGTWLGVTPQARWAAVTNFRDASDLPRPDAPSRGDLVVEFLRGSRSPADHVSDLVPRAVEYNGFNLLVGDAEGVAWISNRGDGGVRPAFRVLEPGVYGVSNSLLDTPWPKVRKGKELLRDILSAAGPVSTASLMQILLDGSFAADHELPGTGVPIDLERALSAAFIVTPQYGTRSSSAVLIGRDGEIDFAERSYDSAGREAGEVTMRIPVPA